MKKLLFIISLFISLAAQAYEPLIREGRVWVYDDAANTEFTEFEEKGGVTYYKLKKWSVPTIDLYDLIREEGHKIYLYTDQHFWENVGEFMIDADFNFEEFKEQREILLYDFDMEVGDAYYLPVSNEYLSQRYISKVYVTGKKKVRNKLTGKEHTMLTFGIYPDDSNPRLTVYDGIGPDYADLAAPYGFMIPTSYLDIINPTLEKVYYKDTEEILYEPGCMEEIEADNVNDVNIDNNRHDTRMYNLMGREIRNPQRGTIYIQDGEKHIAR